jgi:hypothetical protein
MDRIVTTTNGIYLWSSHHVESVTVPIMMLTRNVLNQGFLLVKLKSSRGKCYSPHHDVNKECSEPRVPDDFNLTNRNPWFRTFLVNIMMGTVTLST